MTLQAGGQAGGQAARQAGIHGVDPSIHRSCASPAVADQPFLDPHPATFCSSSPAANLRGRTCKLQMSDPSVFSGSGPRCAPSYAPRLLGAIRSCIPPPPVRLAGPLPRPAHLARWLVPTWGPFSVPFSCMHGAAEIGAQVKGTPRLGHLLASFWAIMNDCGPPRPSVRPSLRRSSPGTSQDKHQHNQQPRALAGSNVFAQPVGPAMALDRPSSLPWCLIGSAPNHIKVG
jgi:hypothetical protein